MQYKWRSQGVTPMTWPESMNFLKKNIGVSRVIEPKSNNAAEKWIWWDEMVETAVYVEAKAGLRSTSYVRKTDRHRHRGNRPAHTATLKA